MNAVWPAIEVEALVRAEALAGSSTPGAWDEPDAPADLPPRGNDFSPLNRQWLREIRRYTDEAIRSEDMGMMAASIPEFALSIYESKRWIKRVNDRIVVTQWGRNFLGSYE